MDRKGALLAFVLFAFNTVLGTGLANALTTCIVERGCVVPYAMYNGSGMDTVVGITIAAPVANQGIYWSLYNANGVELMSNSIPITAGRFEYSFSLTTGAAGAHSGEAGWILFTWDDDGVLNPAEAGVNISASAFLVNLTSKDAAFLPVVPVSVNDYNLVGPITLLNPPNSPLKSMTYGQGNTVPDLSSRFLVSPSGDPRTTLVLFSVLDVPVQMSATAISTTGAIQEGLTITNTNHKLNVFDMESIVPPGFTEGALIVGNTPGPVVNVQFSLIFWSAVGAEQTILSTELFHP